MSDQTPKWMTELKEWGIDVEVFSARWEQAGDDAKEQFQKALAKAQEEFTSFQKTIEGEIDQAKESAKEFVGKMNSAWDEMVSSLKKELRS